MSEELSCSEVGELLDRVAADELAGADIGERYPAFVAHLRQCNRCRAAYLMLLDALRCEQETASLAYAVSSPPLLSFLDADDESPWRRLGRDAASPFPLTFEVDHSYIQRALSGPGLTGVRADSAACRGREVLLLADWVSVRDAEWMVELTAHRQPDHPQMMDLEARLVTVGPLPAALWVSLSWGDQSRSAPLDVDGVAHLRDVSLSQLIEPHSGRIQHDLTVSLGVECANEGERD